VGVAGAAALDEAAEAGVEAEGATGVMGATGETGLSVAAEVSSSIWILTGGAGVGLIA